MVYDRRKSDTNFGNKRYKSFTSGPSHYPSGSQNGPSNEDFKFHISNLDFATKVDDVKEWITTRFGQVKSAKIITNHGGVSRGFGFVQMANIEGSTALDEYAKSCGSRITMLGRKNVKLQKHDGRGARDPKGNWTGNNDNKANTRDKYDLKRHHADKNTNRPHTSGQYQYKEKTITGVPQPPTHGNNNIRHMDSFNGFDNRDRPSSIGIFPQVDQGRLQGVPSGVPASAQSYSTANSNVNPSAMGLTGDPQYTQNNPTITQYNEINNPLVTSVTTQNTNITPQYQQHQQLNARTNEINEAYNPNHAAYGQPQQHIPSHTSVQLSNQQPALQSDQAVFQQPNQVLSGQHSNNATGTGVSVQNQQGVYYPPNATTGGHTLLNVPFQSNGPVVSLQDNLDQAQFQQQQQPQQQLQQIHQHNLRPQQQMQQPQSSHQQQSPHQQQPQQQVHLQQQQIQQQQQQIQQQQQQRQQLSTTNTGYSNPSLLDYQDQTQVPVQNRFTEQITNQNSLSTVPPPPPPPPPPKITSVPVYTNGYNNNSVPPNAQSGMVQQVMPIQQHSSNLQPQQHQEQFNMVSGLTQRRIPQAQQLNNQQTISMQQQQPTMYKTASRPYSDNKKVLISNIPISIKSSDMITYLSEACSTVPSLCTIEQSNSGTGNQVAHIEFQTESDANRIISLGVERKMVLFGNCLNATVDRSYRPSGYGVPTPGCDDSRNDVHPSSSSPSRSSHGNLHNSEYRNTRGRGGNRFHNGARKGRDQGGKRGGGRDGRGGLKGSKEGNRGAGDRRFQSY